MSIMPSPPEGRIRLPPSSGRQQFFNLPHCLKSAMRQNCCFVTSIIAKMFLILGEMLRNCRRNLCATRKMPMNNPTPRVRCQDILSWHALVRRGETRRRASAAWEDKRILISRCRSRFAIDNPIATRSVVPCILGDYSFALVGFIVRKMAKQHPPPR